MTYSGSDCGEVWSFGNDGTLFILSGQEFIFANYDYFPGTPRSHFNFQVQFDNGGMDCEGDSENDAGYHFGPIYLSFTANTVSLFEFPSGGTALDTWLVAPDAFMAASSDSNSIQVVSVQPATVSPGTLTQMQVEIDYNLAQESSFTFYFNENHIAAGNTTEITLPAGTGTETILAETTPYDWGDDSAFYLYYSLRPLNSDDTLLHDRHLIPLNN